jgi:hypothetical protein
LDFDQAGDCFDRLATILDEGELDDDQNDAVDGTPGGASSDRRIDATLESEHAAGLVLLVPPLSARP